MFFFPFRVSCRWNRIWPKTKKMNKLSNYQPEASQLFKAPTGIISCFPPSFFVAVATRSLSQFILSCCLSESSKYCKVFWGFGFQLHAWKALLNAVLGAYSALCEYRCHKVNIYVRKGCSLLQKSVVVLVQACRLLLSGFYFSPKW